MWTLPSKWAMVAGTEHVGLTTLTEHTMHDIHDPSDHLARAAARIHAGEAPDGLTVDLILEATQSLKVQPAQVPPASGSVLSRGARV